MVLDKFYETFSECPQVNRSTVGSLFSHSRLYVFLQLRNYDVTVNMPFTHGTYASALCAMALCPS